MENSNQLNPTGQRKLLRAVAKKIEKEDTKEKKSKLKKLRTLKKNVEKFQVSTKSLGKGKLVGKAKAKIIPKISAIKTIKELARTTDPRMVTPGKEGFIDKEMMKERTDFLGGYNL